MFVDIPVLLLHYVRSLCVVLPPLCAHNLPRSPLPYTSECSAVVTHIPLIIGCYTHSPSVAAIRSRLRKCERSRMLRMGSLPNSVIYTRHLQDQPSLGRFTIHSLSQLIPPFHPSLSFSPFLLAAKRPFPYDTPIMVSKQQATSDTVEDCPPISVPDSEDTGESGKLKMIVQLVRKCMGIKDIASMCVSTFHPRARC